MVKTDDSTQEPARHTLDEIQSYLADELAPMMTIDAIQELLRMPPEYGAAAIEQWLGTQLNAPDGALPVSRYLYHAVKKFHIFGELALVNASLMDRYVAKLSQLVIRLCPELERTELKLRLSRIGEVKSTLSSPLDFLNREIESQQEEERIQRAKEMRKKQATAKPLPRPGASLDASTDGSRVETLIGRLEELQDTGESDPAEGESDEVLARLVSKVAVVASNPAQFDASLERIRQLGGDTKLDNVFRLLGKQLPGWEIDSRRAPTGSDDKIGRLLEAMHRVVALAESPEQAVQRFSELVYAAVEQFNDGHLGQAVAMLDVAERLIVDKKVDAGTAGIIRMRVRGSISSGSLRQFALAPAKHGLLRRVLRFFPEYEPQNLLERLEGEPKREVRKLILTLIEVQGAGCRGVLLDRLASCLGGAIPDPDGFSTRNAVFLLRRIPMGPENDPDQELGLLDECSRPTRPFLVVKEAIGALAKLDIPGAQRVLLERLSDFEVRALSTEPGYDPEEILEILDRCCAALAIRGTRDAVCGLVDHALRRESGLGLTIGRLGHLASCDLARHPGQLKRLLDTIRKMMPAKLMGLVLGGKARHLPHLIRALSGTRDSRARDVLEEIVKRFPGQDYAVQASKTLAAFQVQSAPETEEGVELSGDLDVFGLPTLLQSVADTKLTGRLVISESNGRERAVILFASGQVTRCEVGRLRGLDAICQLFERPRPAKFCFQKESAGDPVPAGDQTMGVMETILEAMRRHDEFQEDRAVVPDGASLMPGEKNPSLPEGEPDRKFVSAVWHEAARGTAPETCEGVVNSDAYRVRRLYAHWFESGALVRRPKD